jgi:hypothetical protein
MTSRSRRFPRSVVLVLILAAIAGAAPAARAARADALALRWVQVVSPGESIQHAIDYAAPGGWVLFRPGVYRETANATNGLVITRSVNLVGLSTEKRRVVLENSGGQNNGIAAVQADHANCMECHSSLAPPFPRLPGVARLAPMTRPTIRGLRIQGITIKDFVNNGLFTRGVADFAINVFSTTALVSGDFVL